MPETVASPDSNTGSLDTWPTRPLGSTMQRSVDWLAVTYPQATDDAPGVYAPAPLPHAEWHTDRGQNGYGTAWVHSSGARVLYRPPMPSMGTHVLLPGRALAEIDARGGSHAWRAWLACAMGAGAQVRRLDYACDDTTGWLTVSRALVADSEGTLTRRSQAAPAYIGGGKGYGQGTATFGVRGSGVYVRVYDKAGEQAGKRGSSPTEQRAAYNALSPWVRLEYEFRDATAHNIAERLVAGDQQAPAGAATWAWAMRTRTADSNRARWPLDPTFERLVLRGAWQRPVLAQAEGSVEQRMEWLTRVAARALCVVWTALQADEDAFDLFLRRAMASADARLTIEDEAAIAEYTGRDARRYEGWTEREGAD